MYRWAPFFDFVNTPLGHTVCICWFVEQDYSETEIADGF